MRWRVVATVAVKKTLSFSLTRSRRSSHL